MHTFLVYLIHIRSGKRRPVCTVRADTLASAREKTGCFRDSSHEMRFIPGIEQTFPPREEMLLIDDMQSIDLIHLVVHQVSQGEQIPEVTDKEGLCSALGKMRPLP